MANELSLDYDAATGLTTLYALMRPLGNQVQVVQTSDGAAVTYVEANRANYKIALAEDVSGSRHYVGSVPAGVAAGDYTVTAYLQAGGSPAGSDAVKGFDQDFRWSSSAVVPLYNRLAPATAGRTLVVDAAGLADANTVKLGPSGSGTAQTARDIGASVLLSSGTGTGQVKLSSGYVAPNWGDVGNPTTTNNLSGTTVKAVTDNVNSVLADGVVHGGTSAQLVLGGTGVLGGLSIAQNNDFPAVLIQSQSNTYSAFRIDNIGAGGCINLTSDGNLPVVNISQSGNGPAVKIDSDCTGDTAVVEIEHQGTSATGAGAAFRATGGNAIGMYVTGGSVGLQVAAGTYDILADIQGDLSGKVLGGGSGTITGTGARADVRAWNGTAPNNLQSGRVDSYLAAAGLQADAAEEIGTALLDLADGVETSYTVRQALRVVFAAIAGKRSNAGTLLEQYDAVGQPGTARIVANCDASGDGTPTVTP